MSSSAHTAHICLFVSTIKKGQRFSPVSSGVTHTCGIMDMYVDGILTDNRIKSNLNLSHLHKVCS